MKVIGFMRPIRTRAYHRALKRGEPWAVTQKSWSDLTNNIIHDLYVHAMNTYLLTDNKLLGLSKWLPQHTIPIVYKKEHTIPVVHDAPFFGLDRSVVPFRFSEQYKPTDMDSLWSRIKSWFTLRK